MIQCPVAGDGQRPGPKPPVTGETADIPGNLEPRFGGHVLGVIAAHDRALRLLPRRDQLTGQLPLLIVMVGYTLSGLYLLLTV